MAIDAMWEKIFSERDWGRYPSEDVIRCIARNFYRVPQRKEIKILDLGCGGGAHTWYMAREGFDVYAIDGSPSAIKQTERLLAMDQLSAHLQHGDIKKLTYENNYFDAVLDCNAIQHNYWQDIQGIHREILRVLKPNGLLLSMMLSEDTTGTLQAEKLEENTFRGFNNPFITPNVLAHLFTQDSISFLMQEYVIDEMSQITRMNNNKHDCIAHYILTARKKSTM